MIITIVDHRWFYRVLVLSSIFLSISLTRRRKKKSKWVNVKKQ